MHQRRSIYLEKRICSDNVVLQILARRGFNDVRAMCDIYQISVDASIKRSVHYVKDLFVQHFISSFNLNVLLYIDVCPCIVYLVCFYTLLYAK